MRGVTKLQFFGAELDFDVQLKFSIKQNVLFGHGATWFPGRVSPKIPRFYFTIPISGARSDTYGSEFRVF